MYIPKRKKPLLLAIIGVAVVGTFLLITNGGHRVASATQKQKPDGKITNEVELPIADYLTSDVTTYQRQNKSIRHNKPYMKIKEISEVTEVTEAESWIEALPSLPVKQSDAILIGEVSEAQAYLSSDKTGVYSEFTIIIEAILKDTIKVLLAPGSTITAQREGGRVKFPSGHIQSYKLSGQGAPRVGGRYVLFLKHIDQGEDFIFLTGYELREGRVVSLDKVSSHAAYNGSDESAFLNTVRDAITSQASSTDRR